MYALIRLPSLLLLSLCLLTAACASKPPAPVGVKIGKPYEVYGRWYTPAYDPTYDETGVASWYGPGFHGHNTSSGERYDQDELTAAHRTLPMPSLVRVTNLDNGKSAIIRINDRGPYHSDRIIDLSKASAQALGITGTANVRVQYLKEETEAYLRDHNIPGKEIILAGDAPQGTASVQPADAPTHHFWDIIPEANAEEAPATAVPLAAAPQPAGAGITSADLPPIRPLYKVQSNMNTPQSPMTPHVEVIPLHHTSPFAPPPGSQIVPQEGTISSSPPSLARAMDMADEEAIQRESPSAAPPFAKPQLLIPSPADMASGFYVQVASFSQKSNADDMIGRLQGLNAQMTETQTSGRTIYRVRHGPFASQDEARQAVSKLAGEGVMDARIVKP